MARSNTANRGPGNLASRSGEEEARRPAADDPRWEAYREAMAERRSLRGRVRAAWPGYLELDLGDGVPARTRRHDIVPPSSLADLDQLVGHEVAGLVVAVEAEGRGVIVSPRHLSRLRFDEALGGGRRLQGRIVAANPGGVIVEVDGARGFVPHRELDGEEARDFPQVVGRAWRGHVLKSSAQNFVLTSHSPRTRRRLLRRRERALRRARPGVELRGKVVSIMGWGAWVHMRPGPLRRRTLAGLVPRDELSWWKVWSPNDVVRVGQRLKARIVSVEPREGLQPPEITLSRRAFLPNPWPRLARELPPGMRVECEVTKTAPFGAVVRLLAHPEVESVILEPGEERFAPGTRLWVEVDRVDTGRGRLYLASSGPEAKAKGGA